MVVDIQESTMMVKNVGVSSIDTCSTSLPVRSSDVKQLSFHDMVVGQYPTNSEGKGLYDLDVEVDNRCANACGLQPMLPRFVQIDQRKKRKENISVSLYDLENQLDYALHGY
ncbi:hypothetical protein V6N12_009342 [Hibiscus sabdariffa]|uniref:Uncharacterized protein n=1 Tax=Hibiscus sabdariffa TaxID=183260 RepID=A0ABR2E8U9_9ROSI